MFEDYLQRAFCNTLWSLQDLDVFLVSGYSPGPLYDEIEWTGDLASLHGTMKIWVPCQRWRIYRPGVKPAKIRNLKTNVARRYDPCYFTFLCFNVYNFFVACPNSLPTLSPFPDTHNKNSNTMTMQFGTCYARRRVILYFISSNVKEVGKNRDDVPTVTLF